MTCFRRGEWIGGIRRARHLEEEDGDGSRSRITRQDRLITGASQGIGRPFAAVTDEDWARDLALKLLAAVRASRLAIPLMRRRGGGRIINVVNFISKQPPAESMPTSVTRAAGLALTKALYLRGALAPAAPDHEFGREEVCLDE